jgi:hypothetical protein
LIVEIEARERRTIKIDDAEDAVASDQGDHQLRARGGVAGDVVGESVHILDQHGPSSLDRRATDAATDSDADAFRHAPERPQY